MSHTIITSLTPAPDAKAAIRALLQPYSIEDFLSRYWEREHLHVSRDDTELAVSLMSVEDVDELLTKTYSSGARRWDAVRVARDGYLVPSNKYLRNREGP